MSKPEVYIVEWLDIDDEDHRKEGEILAKTLTLSGKHPIYRYVRTKKELEYFIKDFQKVDYRYLHFSCHGNNDRLALTLDKLDNAGFADIVAPALDRKRLFLSTCLAATEDLAEKIFAGGGCTTVAGPVNKIAFDDAAVFWTAFYHLMFKKEGGRMVNRDIKENITLLGHAMYEQFRLFTADKGKISKTQVLPTDEILKKRIDGLTS